MSTDGSGSMSGKTVLVTGGTGGIGKATASGLAGLRARVGIVGRDQERAEATVREIQAQHPSALVDAFVADLSSQAEVRQMAADVLATYPRLDVLINNVGGFWAHRHLTVDGLERTFAVNHLAPFLLTDLLLERLVASGPARIVTVASGVESMGQVDFEDLQGSHDYSAGRAYSQSKLANVLFTYELARRLGTSPVTANALHPGMVRTDFGAEDQEPFWKVLAPAVRPFMRSPERGARTSIHLASASAVEGVTGTYFANSRPKTSGKASYDVASAARLWRESARIVGAS